ncbi:hypothetical protein [Clostridium sp. Ade.TY]|uniref:Hpt domain-containing protein n=1 Tax=Clostridium sp. Ade.TY TaxID=1391647 RepID=UPI00041DA12E|nr:hypothetical protein [Clostridium sp. Ade.TY]
MNIGKGLEMLGINKVEIISRFGGNIGLVERFIKAFLNDNTYFELKEAVYNLDYKEIEIKAHTLKGISLNLSLNKLFLLCTKLVKEIREEKYNNIDKLFLDIKYEYERVREIISNLN